MDENAVCAQGGEGNTRLDCSEPGKTLIQLGQPTQLNQHRDIGMQHSSFPRSFRLEIVGIGIGNVSCSSRFNYFSSGPTI